MGMAQRQQKLAAAGVNIQDALFRRQRLPDQSLIAPGQILLLGVAAGDVGKIPALDVGLPLFLQPQTLPFLCGSVHAFHKNRSF